MSTIKLKPVRYRLAFPELRTALVRERLMAMVKLRLQQIRMANGYLTDFGVNVHRGMLIVAEPDVPCINFWDTDESNIKGEYGLQVNTLTVIVATYDKTEFESGNPDELCPPAVNVLKDIEIAMQRNHITDTFDPGFDGMVQQCSYTGSQHVSGLQPELWIQTVSTFTLIYTTRVGDPYQQTAA